jgi:hypothetical protein
MCVHTHKMNFSVSYQKDDDDETHSGDLIFKNDSNEVVIPLQLVEGDWEHVVDVGSI